MTDKIKALLGDKYKIKIDGTRLKEFEEIYEEQRILEPIHIELTDKITKSRHTVDLSEAYECCGKLYAYNFGVTNPLDTKVLIQILEPIAKYLDYSYIGFVHQANHVTVTEAKELGYKELIAFKNKRSGNTLSEMCKILQ